ncbi:hypothetical protein BLOT_007706 [Blomia tropicalis]|nr:hypothetical protein BLOT_007706 [Blomia tropicalis]
MKQYCITSVTSLTTILVIIINLYQLPTLINSAPTANHPCQIEDENWSETYFHDEQANEKYDHISEDELERFDPILSDDDDDIIIDNETEENENSGKVKVTLTKLSGKAKYGYDILLEMIRRSHVLQDLVTDMIRKVTYSTLILLSANEKGPKRILNSFFNKRVHARRVADDFLMVSSNLRAFMCHFKRAFQLFEINVPTTEIVQQVLNHRINSDLTCARMAVLDCQLMQNSVRVFSDIEQFLRIYHSRINIY